jgi:hypothetical protein
MPPSDHADEDRQRPRWIPRDEFVQLILAHQADSQLADDLVTLTGGETTDDLELR